MVAAVQQELTVQLPRDAMLVGYQAPGLECLPRLRLSLGGVDARRPSVDSPEVELRGVGASPGHAKGILCFEGDAAPNAEFVLVCREGGAEDRALLEKASGVLSIRGGLTGDIAIMARVLGKPCVVSCHEVSLIGRELVLQGGVRIASGGATVHLDGAAGTVTLKPVVATT